MPRTGPRSLALGAVVTVLLVGARVVPASPWSPSDSGRAPAHGDAAAATARDTTTDDSDIPVTPAVPAHRAGAVRPEVPVGSRLPSGTVVPIRPVSSLPDGTLDVPHDIRTAGWWRGGARLGDPFGSTLLAAHVDSFTQGLGPYAELLSVRPGQQIALRSSHLRQTFRVTSLRLVPKGSLEREHRIFSARGPRRLTLVTCAGPYIVSRGGYQRLAVITAVPTGPAVRGGVG